MNIAVAIKALPDSQDIIVSSDRSLDLSKAKLTISEYDTNALEVAAQLGEGDGTTYAVSVGPKAIDESKLKKNILSRGIDELVMAADDSLDGLDAYQTAQALAKLVATKQFDLVILGDGSADNYAQQVDVQLAAELGLPLATAVSHVEKQGDSIVVTRLLEDSLQKVELKLPAVISVVPDIAVPRIPGMKDILAAGKKPMEIVDAPAVEASSLELVSCLAPEQADRKLQIKDASEDGAISEFAELLKSCAK